MAVQLNLFDLNLLRSLDALLHERSVTVAADKLHVTQQAMSGSLKRLREHFQDELLVRNGLRLELTPRGAALLGPVRDAMLRIALAVDAMPTFVPAETERQFRVAMSDYSVATFLPALTGRIVAEAPKLQFEIHEVLGTVFASLTSGDLDMTMHPNAWRLTHGELPRGVRFTKLFDDDFACAIDAKAHGFDALTLERYLSLPHAATRLEGGGHTLIGSAWLKQGINPRVAVSTTSFASTLLMLPGTPMIATVQRRLIMKFAKSLPIRLLECPVEMPRLEQELYWHERSDDDPVHAYARSQFIAAAHAMDDLTG